ncbi:hypothetical protein [Brevundimonas fluminis]|uniref:hypothetical protein n=1 Tax=Brevundimonas fluminis TaxID=2487274 RepID=UPI0013DE4A7C|nr:hypothetical protein [Brevundimonas fluminis]
MPPKFDCAVSAREAELPERSSNPSHKVDPDPYEGRDRRLRIYSRLSEQLSKNRKRVSAYIHISEESFERLAKGQPMRADTWLKVFHSPGGRTLPTDLKRDVVLEFASSPTASFGPLLAALAGKLAGVSSPETVVEMFDAVLAS